MKTPLLLLAAVCCAVLTSGCALTEKYNKNAAAGQSWLRSNDRGPAKTNFEGVYYSPDWGTIVFNQAGNKLTGAVGYYQVNGLVSGRSAYLLLVDDQWIERTMILRKKNSEVLEGTYSSHVPYSASNKLPVSLDRILQ